MYKENNKQKNDTTRTSAKQLSIRNFFSSGSIKKVDIAPNSLKSPVETNQINQNLSSPDIIEATPDQQRRKSEAVSPVKKSIPSRKQLVYSSHSEKRKQDVLSEYTGSKIQSDNLLKVKHSPSKQPSDVQCSLKKNKISDNSSICLVKNNGVKRLKLSSSSSRQKENEESATHCKPLKLAEKNNKFTPNTSRESMKMTLTETPRIPDIENLDDLFNDDWDDFKPVTHDLKLNEWTYCRIKTVEFLKTGVLVKLEEYRKNVVHPSMAICLLKGCWLDTPVQVDDIVSVKAHYDFKTGYWMIDNEEGFIIIYPDVLITGTGIVESLFCPRRSVLGNIFPGSDPPNIAMVIGSLVHELLQEILERKLFSKEDMKAVINKLMQSRKTLFLAYECDLPLTSIQSELNEFLPRISSFINTYFVEYKRNEKKTWTGEILEILSIEENFWVPELGIKGKTDVILKARDESKIKILPLELKTGRATNSSEHRGQIVLYSMMMSETGLDVDSGLLLYLRFPSLTLVYYLENDYQKNKLNEIKPKHPERSGLLSMRNNLVNFISANETLKFVNDEFQLPTLPEPINHHSGCAKCPYLTVCSASLSEEHRNHLSKNNPLLELSVKSLEHLSASHIRYIFHWFGLLKLEEAANKRSRSFDISDVWHMDAAKREARGFCISNLCIQKIEDAGSKFLHKMKRCSEDTLNLSTCGLVEGDYIVISRGSRYALATGYVYCISDNHISLKLDRRLETDNSTYTVDKYSMYSSLLAFNTSSLILLFENSVQAEKLRSLIIDIEMPKFSGVCLKYDENILCDLNDSQRNAVLRALQTKDYMLIKGMPGTGKTATIVALVKLLVSLNFTVLITSHTHSAVDNILLRLRDKVDFLRLGNNVRIHSALKSYSEDSLLKAECLQSVQDLENFYQKKQVVAVTCMGCSHALFRKRVFDYCIVDEATQVMQPSVIKSLYSSKKFVLIGDPEQLPPVVQSKEASRLGLSESLFKRLDRPDVTSVLYLQYRMNAEIMKLSNLFSYENALRCANENVSSATINSTTAAKQISQQNWLQLVVSDDLSHSVVLLNTSNLPSNSTSEYSNHTEMNIVFTILTTLQKECNNEHDIGIIAPFREQVELLRKTASIRKYDVEINTVDQYQGRDKDIIIYSCTKSSSTRDSGILSDKRRLTVAITRAKRKLIIIGNVEVLKTYSVFNELFSFIPDKNTVKVNKLLI